MKLFVSGVVALALAVPLESSARGGGGGGHSGGHSSSSHSSSSHSGSSHISSSSSSSHVSSSGSHSAAASPGTGAKSSSTTVHGYTKKDGTYVAPAKRTTPDKNFNNNYSTKGNTNPYTGKAGTKTSKTVKH